MSIDISRISGLASGLDTESIVKKLMEAERIPLNKMEQQKQLLEWKRDAYREINALLLDLRNLTFDMRLQGTYLKKTASSSRTDIVAATASGSASEGVHTVKVEQLAKGIHAASQDSLEKSARDANGNILKLKDQFSGLLGAPDIADTIKFKIQNDQGFFQEFTFSTKDNSIYDVINEINKYSDQLKIKASYDENLNRVFLNSTVTGSQVDLIIEEIDGNNDGTISDSERLFTKYLNFNFTADTDNNPDTLTLKGEDAKIVYNGVTITHSTNQIVVNGLTLDLKSAAPGQEVTISVTRNTEEVFNKIVAFVNKYNEVIDKINSKLVEPRYRDYPPLTEAQKEEMTEKQIELWEEKAKSGLLNGDPMLFGAVSQFRQDFASSVEGLPAEFDSMFDIGLKTGTYEQRGKIIIDEDKLRQALNTNPEQVMELFTRTHDKDHSQRGLAARLYESIDRFMEQITEKAGSGSSFSKVDNSFLGKEIDRLEERMDEFEKRLADIEDRYWRQFTAMEKAIQRANMQSAWLMQQFGGGM
ncbi:flagellar hook-associated protein 2 [Bacillaceae bacterium]